jgi:hypothetical protein
MWRAVDFFPRDRETYFIIDLPEAVVGGTEGILELMA